ncbi:MAG: hypothetical protein JW720_00435 [Sedimentisphaerales bacterium]|nr:hypothetical protein [Sedimentisphaerales bacterium]
MTKKYFLIPVLTFSGCIFCLAGCDGGKKKAEADAEQAREEALKVRVSLQAVKARVADLEEELSIVKDIRDTLDVQVQQLTAERDKALGKTVSIDEPAKFAPVEVYGEDQKLVALQGEVERLKKIIAEQDAVIAEQHATIDELAKAVTSAEPAVAEPAAAEPAAEDAEDANEPAAIE